MYRKRQKNRSTGKTILIFCARVEQNYSEAKEEEDGKNRYNRYVLGRERSY